ncbi:MAG: aspartate aminotransferase family protein [Candidatus Hydrogenedentes bacterium]|nr:aspartate aminotransferase family protein [Candidatus Hydrogenedentota bacterium]
MGIFHFGEEKGNFYRSQWNELVGRGQQTYTPTQIVVERAQGVYLYTVDRRKLIDFTSGVLVSNLGYSHPLFERKFRYYYGELPRNTYNMITPIQVEASRRLIESFGYSKAQKILWAASGSEGIQKAMWCALHRYPDRFIIVATRHGFHGKKGLAADVTGESSPNPNVRWISFPMGEGYGKEYYKKELDNLWDEYSGKVALLITEPYLGAKGSYHPPKWYHKLLQEWCNSHDIPFIFDEVQSCFGRTGNMYAFQTYEVEPDLVVLGKGMANGEPASAVVGREDLIESLEYGEASDTFSGGTSACCAVCATMDVFEEENIIEHVREITPYFQMMLSKLKERFSFIVDVRGEGLVYGIDCVSSEIANMCVLEAYYGVGSEGVHFLGPLAKKVLRVSPPLIITEEEIDRAFEILNSAWERIE